MEVFKGKFDDAQRRIRVLKEKLAMARATITSLEEAKNPRGRGEEWSLERVAGEATELVVAKEQVSESDALKGKAAALEKVSLDFRSQFLKTYLL